MKLWKWVSHKAPFKDGFAVIARNDHRLSARATFSPTSDYLEFEGHKYQIDQRLIVRLKGYDPVLDGASFDLIYILRYFSLKKIGILRFREWKEGIKEPVQPIDHVQVMDEHRDEKTNPNRYKVMVVEEVNNQAYKSIKQRQELSKKWLIAIIIIVIGVAALMYLMLGGGATVHAP